MWKEVPDDTVVEPARETVSCAKSLSRSWGAEVSEDPGYTQETAKPCIYVQLVDFWSRRVWGWGLARGEWDFERLWIGELLNDPSIELE